MLSSPIDEDARFLAAAHRRSKRRIFSAGQSARRCHAGLQWDVTRTFYLGVQAMYLQQDSASSAMGFVPSVVGVAVPAQCSLGDCRLQESHTWVFTMRTHKDFLSEDAFSGGRSLTLRGC